MCRVRRVRRRVSAKIWWTVTPSISLESFDEEGPDGVFVRVPFLLVQGRDDLGGPGQRRCAEDVGGPAFVPGGAGGPADGVQPRLAHGAAAGKVRCAGVEPVRPAHEDAGAERGVQLVAGEGEVIDVVRADVDPPVRGELRRVHDDPGAVFVGQRGQAADRQDFAGDVGGAGHGQEADVAVREFCAQPVHRCSQGVGAATTLRCGTLCHGSRLAWCSMSR